MFYFMYTCVRKIEKIKKGKRAKAFKQFLLATHMDSIYTHISAQSTVIIDAN